MKSYCRWVIRQFCLLVLRPSRFAKEVEGEDPGSARMTRTGRSVYIVGLLPWLAAPAVLGNLLAGSLIDAWFGSYHWAASWSGVAFGVTLTVPLGVAFGIPLGIAFGIALGASLGVAVGSAEFVAPVITGLVTFGFSLGTVGRCVPRVGSVFLLGVVSSGVLGFVSALNAGAWREVARGIDVGIVSCFAFPLTFSMVFFRLGTYPLNALLCRYAYNAARTQPAAALRWWRRCPVAWNEVIYLPMPDAGRLLALSLRLNRIEGLKEVWFVIAERRLQIRVAIQALSEVALDDLEAGTTAMVSSTPERLAWTSESPLALPEDFTEAQPRFERAAHQASQFLAVSSDYRKADALKRAVEEVDSLQKTLIASPGKFSPRLLQIANRWREILEAEQAGLKQLAAERRETPNPFIFGNPVDERNANVFAGRQDVARHIEQSLLGARLSPALLVYGARRMGKSSILKQLPRLLGPDFAPALLDCQNPAVGGGEASTASLLRYLSTSLSDGLQRRRVDVKPLTAEELAREPFAAFDAWLGHVEQAMPPGMRALLCLDEYERLQRALDAGWGGDFLDALRHTIQHRPRFVLLFTGAHTFAEMGPAWTDRFISARRVRVSFLQPDDVRPLLTKPIPEFDLTYAPGAVDAVIAATRCQPFLVQAVAFELVQYLNEQQRKEAAPADAEKAITRALESGGEYFANVWSDAGKEGQAILREIARSGVGADVRRLKSMTNDEFRMTKEDQRGLTSVAKGALKWLREHDVLDDAGQFAVPMMARWVREEAS